MSKDIRSYFSLKISSKDHDKIGKKVGQKRRSVVLIDSDSDDEKASANTKRVKPSEVKEQAPTRKKEVKNVASHYFKTEEINVRDFFGNRPVKRDNSRNIIKKIVTKDELEFHLDKDFEAELAKLDGQIDHIPFLNGQPNSHSRKASHNISEPGKAETNDGIVKFEKTSSSITNVEPSDSIIPQSKKLKLEDTKKSPKKFEEFVEITRSKQSPESCKKYSPSSKWSKTVLNERQIQKNEKKGVTKEDTETGFSFNSKASRPKTISFQDVSSQSSGYGSLSCDSPITASSCSEETIHSQSSLPFIQENEVNVPCNLWVEKYKPLTTKQIIGQQGDKSCVNKLMYWLKNWHKSHSGNKKLSKPSPWAKNDDGAYFKVALLSGPPGVGKTTTAHLVSKELGFDVVEFNASDTRSKKLLHQEVSELLSTKSLSPFLTGNRRSEAITKKHVLLMDEVDGMAGNEDRGGVQELIQLVKSARVPIICMCNDRNHPKIRSLANYCFDLRFSKPRAEQIRGAMMSMCFKEQLKVSPKDLSEIIVSANQDIRLIINHLSMLSIGNTRLANSSKHIKLGLWDITRKIFSEEEHRTMSIYDKCDLFFHDYNATSLFVQENYLNAVPHKPEAKNKIKKMELFARAATSLSLGDLTEKNIRSHNAWGLLPVQAVFSSLIPGEVLEGHIGAKINFPAWFGKNSRQTKTSRLLQELTVHTRLKISGNKEAMNLDYLMPLERSILMPLVTFGTDGIPAALAVLSEYCLVREDIDSFSELSAWPNSKNLFAEVDSKVKSAFTRAYNKTSAPTPYAAVPIKKASKSDVESMDFATEEGEGPVDMDEEEQEDDLDVDAMIVVKKKAAGKAAVTEKNAAGPSKGSKTSKRGRKK